MSKSIKAVLIATALTGSVAAGVALANPRGDVEGCGRGQHAMGSGRHHGDHESRMERMADVLGLTKEQRDAVRAIVDKSRPQKRALRDTLRENRRQLRALMQAGTPSESEVRKIADAQGRVMADMIVLRTKTRAEINAVLTQEQREKIQNMRKWRRHEKSSPQRSRAGDVPEAAFWKGYTKPKDAVLTM
jgi:Spy/CpxP family protein refolding chaperone